MLTSGSDFPKDQLMNCLRSGGKGKEEFVKQAKKLNIQWIYEIIKYCCNVLFEGKEMPDAKVTSLTLIKDLFETCEVPCVHLIEVYILPIIYQFAIYKPQEKADKRGNFFFLNNGYSARLPNIEENGIKFINISTQMVYFGSLIKKKRTFENQQLSQPSQFMEYYEKFKKYAIDGSPTSPKDLKYFSQKTAKTANQKYLKNLNEFQNHCQDYSEYFVVKMVQSLQTEQNPLFSSAGKTVSSLNNDLDMRKILKYGDTYITSPLLQELTQGLKTAENFLIKRNFLSLLSDFVKWADIQSFVQICYDDALDYIAPRIAEVNGQKGLNEGELIFPELKGQKEAKKKFYIQFLKNLQIWAKCIKGDLQDQEEPSKVQQFYQFFKVQRKFVFPQNLMAKRIDADFLKCQEYNSERNQRILQNLRNDKTSMVHNKKSNSINKAALEKSSKMAKQKVKTLTFDEINSNFEECFENFITLADDERLVGQKMKKLLHFKQNFDNDLQNVEQDGRQFEQFEELLDNGDQLIENIDSVEDLYKDYKKKNITFKKFQEQFEAILEKMEMDEGDEQEEAESSNLNSSNNISSNNQASISISRSKKSLRKKLSEKSEKLSNHPVSPQITSKIPVNQTPKLKKQPSKGDIGEKGTSNLSKKIKSKRQSHIKKSTLKSSIQQKKSSMIVSQIPNQSAVPEPQKIQQQPHPYYNENSKSSIRPSKLSKLENKSIHSRKSGLASKLKKRRSQLSDLQSQNQEKIMEEKQNVGENDYMMKPMNSEKKTFKQMIQSHRSSRMSENSSKMGSSIYNSIKRSSKLKSPDNIVYYEKKDSVAQFSDQPSQSQSSQVLIQQVNEGYATVPAKSSVFRGSKMKSRHSNNDYIAEPKGVASNFSRKSLLKDRNRKGNSIMKISRRSSRSGMSSNSAVSSENDQKNGQNVKSKYRKNENADDYMMQPSKFQVKMKPSRISQLSSKRPVTSHSKNKETYEKQQKISQFQEYNRPQTSSNKQTPMDYQQDHYQIRRTQNEGDKIKQPEIKPMENSYYGIEQIQAKVKNTSKMQFKQCLQLQKEIIPVGSKKLNQYIQGFNDAVNKKGKSTNDSSSLEDMNVHKNPQEEYLIMRLRRQHEQQQNNELKKIQGRILKLKTETSKIRSDLSSRSQENREFSLSRRSHSGASSREFCSFSSSKNSKNSSYHSISKEKNNTSRVQIISVEGRLLNTKNYDQHYNQIKDQNLKKTFLRSKVILLKNQYLELGSIFRRERHNLKILMYLTPNIDIFNLNISIARQYNMEVRIFPQVFPQIPKGKQVRITLEVQLKSAPFSMPTMFVNFVKGSRDREQKSYTVILPCSLHRFIEFHQISDRQNFLQKFQSVGQNIIKTSEFRVSRRIGKLDHILQYFPKLTTVMMNGDTHKYGAECTFKRQRFLLILTTRKPQNMVIQGIPLTRPQFLEYFLSFLKHIFTMDQ